MFRRTLIGGVAILMLIGSARLADAQVSVNIGINLPGPPRLVAVPATPVVMYAPSVGANYFFYGNRYYVFANDGWFVGPGYNGPWTIVAPEFVPRPILRVPVRYYRVPPPAWRGWQRASAPRWEPRWGQRWAEHPPVKRAQHQHPPQERHPQQQQKQHHEAPHGAQHHQDKHQRDHG